MTGRYVYTPMTSKKLGHRVTIMDRIRRWNAQRKQEQPDLIRVTGFYEPIRATRR